MMTPPPSLTTRIAHFVCTLQADDVDPRRRHRMRIALLDFLGCVLAGSTLAEAAETRVLARPGRVRIPGFDKGLDLPSAIISWGALGALLQWHDGYGRGGNHPSSSILPVLMARSPYKQQDWQQLLMPAIVGYETTNRLAALTHPHQTIAGSAPTSTMGAIGAAAALCRHEQLDEACTARALGLAGFWAPVAAFEGLRARGNGVPLHSGLAARAGWEAVQAAKAGLQASARLLEGGEGPGLLQWLGGAQVVERLPDPGTWRGETLDQVYLKPFPGCRHVHPAIEAALGLRATLPGDPARWRTVVVRTYDVAIGFGAPPEPQFELYDCLMSLPWGVALALLEGTPGLAAVSADRGRASVRALLARVQVVQDPEHQAGYPAQLGATVDVTLDDGTLCTQQAVLRYAEAGTHYSPSGPFGPVLDEAGVRDKFMRLAAGSAAASARSQTARKAQLQRLAEAILTADPSEQ